MVSMEIIEQGTVLQKSGIRKADFVRDLFAELAPYYDKVSTKMAFNQDKKWRREAAKLAVAHQSESPKIVLDAACGTGELTKELASSGAQKIIGLDFSKEMIKYAKEKVNGRAYFLVADAHKMPFKDSAFECITIAFGLRNYESIEGALYEVKRVLRTSGKLVALDLGKPGGIASWIYYFYLNMLMPRIAKIFVKDNRAYAYIPRSLKSFPEPEETKNMMEKTGFEEVELHHQSCGIACIHVARKYS